MAVFEAKLAWSVQVPVVVLGAHLQAYVTLQPIINTIRLCNRFGKGPKAAISRIPAELMVQVEGYLIEVEREKQQEAWSRDFECSQGLCKPMDHFSELDCIRVWCQTFEDCFNCGGCDCDLRKKQQITELNDRQRRALKSFLQSEMMDEPVEETAWWSKHEDRVYGWMEKTGQPNESGHGQLSKLSTLLLRNFGLSLWVTHTQPSKGKVGQFTQNNVYTSTAAYIIMPCNKFEDRYERGFNDHHSMLGSPYVDMEAGGAAEVTLPSELSKEDICRFARALKVLNLAPVHDLETETPLYASEKDEKGRAEVKAKVEAAGGEGRAFAPRLRLLYSNMIDQDF